MMIVMPSAMKSHFIISLFYRGEIQGAKTNPFAAPFFCLPFDVQRLAAAKPNEAGSTFSTA
jgi:hypothetical protein